MGVSSCGCHTLIQVSPAVTIGKGKGAPITGYEGPEGEKRYSPILSWPQHLDGGGWSAPRPGRFTPGKDPVPIVQEAGLAPGPVWTGVENLAPTGFDPRTVQPIANCYHFKNCSPNWHSMSNAWRRVLYVNLCDCQRGSLIPSMHIFV